MAEMFEQTLISSTRSVNVDPFRIEGRTVTPECPTPWSVIKRRLRGGRQEGVDLVEIDNGRVRLRIVPTRGMNILDAQMGDLRLGWDSPVEEVVHPMFIDPHERGGIGWLAGFNEYVARCGLEWFGAPAQDDHHEAAGEAPAGPLTLHGKVSNTPASELSLHVDPTPPYRITLRGVVRERMLFGPKLELITEISTEPGEAGFRIADRVVNRGSSNEEFGLLYHVNHGRPLLEEGARFIAPAKRVTPATERATAGGVESYPLMGPPEPGYAEKVYFMTLHGDVNGQTRVMLQSRAADRGVSLSWSTAQLPCFTLWKSTQAEADGYVTGLEPCTHYPRPRPAEREAGRVPKLGPGQSHEAAIDFALHATGEEVADAADRIERIQQGREPRIDPQPPG